MTDHLETIRLLQLKLAEREEQHRHAATIQTALYEIAEAAGAATDMQVFYARLHGIIGGLMYARNLFIAVLDQQSGIMSWPYHVDEKDTDEAAWLPEPYKQDKGATYYVLRTGQSVHVERDLARLLSSGELEILGTRPEDGIFVPLTADGTILGVLCVQSYEKGKVYSEEDVQVLNFVSQHIATALSRARAIEETLQRNDELAILNSVGDAMAKTLDVKTVTRIVGDKLLDIFKCEIVSIDLLDRQTDLFHVLYTFDKGEGGYIDYIQPYPLGTGLNSRIVNTRRPLRLGTSKEQMDLGAYIAPEVFEQGSGVIAESWMGVPIIAGDQVLGVASVGNYRQNAFGENEQRLLQTLSSGMGVAIQNARLFEAEQRRVSELEIINSIQQGLASKLDLQAIIDLVGDKLREVLHSNEIGIRLYDEPADLMHYPYEFEHGQRLTIPSAKPNQIFRESQRTHLPVFGKTTELNPRYGTRTIPGTETSRSTASVPIIAGSRVIGAIQLEDYEREDAFSEASIRLMQTIVASMGAALENARLFDETQRLFKAEQQRAAELAIINSVQEGLASKLDFQAIIDLVGDKVRETFKADTTYVFLYDRPNDLILRPYYVERGFRHQLEPLPFGEGLTSIVIRARQPLLLGTTQQAEQLQVAQTEIASPAEDKDLNETYLGVPIMAGNAVIGVVSIQSYQQHAYDDSDVRVLQTLANSMGVALENARLFNEVQKSNREITEALEQQTATSDVLRVIASSPTDVQPVLEVIIDHAVRLCDGVFGALYRTDGAIVDEVAVRNIAAEGMELAGRSYPRPLTRDSSLSSRTILDGVTYHIPDIQNDRTLPELTHKYSRTLGMNSVLFTPMLKDGKAIGAIAVGRREVGPFSEKQIAMLQTFADQGAIAIENVRLFNETKRLLGETEQRAAELAIINSVQEGLASKLDMRSIYELVGEKIRETFGADTVGIITYDDATGLLTDTYSFEKGDRTILAEPIPLFGFRKHVVETRAPMLINRDVERLSKEYGNPVLLGSSAKSCIFVPMLAGDRVTGVITLQNLDQEDAYTESDVRLLQTLANSMSVALENARLFDEVQKNNREISEALEQQTATSDVLRVIASSPADIEPVLAAVAEHAARLCEANDVQIYEVDGDSLRQMTHFGPLPALQDGESLPLVPGLVTGRAVLERRTIHIDVREMSESEYPDSVRLQARLGHKTAISTPLLRQGKAIGAIVGRRNEYRPFTEKQITLLSTFADQAAIAIENVRLFNETQRLLKETEQRAAELSVINSVQQGLASKLDMQAIYDLVGNRIRDIFGTEVVYIAIRSAGDAEHVDFPYYLDRGKRLSVEPVMLGQGITSRVIESRRALRASSMQEQLELGGIYDDEEESQSYLGVPIFVGETVLGVASVQSYRVNAFSESDERLLSTLASSMGVALENARLFDEIQRLLKETEQRNAELAVINSVQSALAAKLDIQAIYDAVGDKVSEIFIGKDVGIRMYDPATNIIYFPYNVEAGKRIEIEPRPRSMAGITNHVLATRQSLLINENADEEAAKYGSYTIPGTLAEKSSLYVPSLSVIRRRDS